MEDCLPSCPHAQHDGKRAARFTWQHEVKASEGFTVPVYLLDIDVPENVAWDPPAYARLSPERYGLQTGRPVFARHRPGSKPSTTEETIIAEGPARCEVDSFEPVMIEVKS